MLVPRSPEWMASQYWHTGPPSPMHGWAHATDRPRNIIPDRDTRGGRRRGPPFSSSNFVEFRSQRDRSGEVKRVRPKWHSRLKSGRGDDMKRQAPVLAQTAVRRYSLMGGAGRRAQTKIRDSAIVYGVRGRCRCREYLSATTTHTPRPSRPRCSAPGARCSSQGRGGAAAWGWHTSKPGGGRCNDGEDRASPRPRGGRGCSLNRAAGGPGAGRDEDEDAGHELASMTTRPPPRLSHHPRPRAAPISPWRPMGLRGRPGRCGAVRSQGGAAPPPPPTPVPHAESDAHWHRSARCMCTLHATWAAARAWCGGVIDERGRACVAGFCAGGVGLRLGPGAGAHGIIVTGVYSRYLRGYSLGLGVGCGVRVQNSFFQSERFIMESASPWEKCARCSS